MPDGYLNLLGERNMWVRDWISETCASWVKKKAETAKFKFFIKGSNLELIHFSRQE